MKHRHLDYAPDTPAEDLPSAALVDILHQGDLDDWRPLAAAVARDPHGALAERIARLLDAYPAYGTSPLWRAFLDRCRARAEGELSRPAPIALAGLRRRMGLTQEALASRLGMSQSDLSKLERRTDVRLKTLKALASALRGRLRILIEIGDEQTEIRLPAASARTCRGR